MWMLGIEPGSLENQQMLLTIGHLSSSLYFHLCMAVCVSEGHMWTETLEARRQCWMPGAGVTGACKLSDVGARN